MSDPTAPAPVTRYYTEVIYDKPKEYEPETSHVVVLAADHERVVGALELRIKELEKVTNGI